MRKMPVLSPGKSAAGLALCGAALLCAGCASNPMNGGGIVPVTPPPQTAYYLDCSAPSDGSGTQASPWNSVNDVNAHAFTAGSSLLIRRGTTCNGPLQPLARAQAARPSSSTRMARGPRL